MIKVAIEKPKPIPKEIEFQYDMPNINGSCKLHCTMCGYSFGYELTAARRIRRTGTFNTWGTNPDELTKKVKEHQRVCKPT